MNVKVGQYFYRPYRGKYGIWKKTDDVFGDDFVCDCYSKSEAARIVKEHNNWK